MRASTSNTDRDLLIALRALLHVLLARKFLLHPLLLLYQLLHRSLRLFQLLCSDLGLRLSCVLLECKTISTRLRDLDDCRESD